MDNKKSLKEQRIEVFKLQIENYLAGNLLYKENIDIVITEAKLLHNNKISLTKINRNNFDVTVFIKREFGDVLNTLNFEEICRKIIS